MNAKKFIDFLRKLRQVAGCPVVVVADNVRYHHLKKVQAFLETQAGKIMIVFLPAYGPEPIPEERACNHAKAEVGKHFIKSKLEIETNIVFVRRSIQKQVEIVKGFFQLPDTLYAEMSAKKFYANTYYD